MAKICVYCGSSEGNHPAWAQAAREVGELMAASGHGLVYGCGGVGIMGHVAKAVKAGGGRVEGIIPEALVGTEHAWEGACERVITQTMRERKQIMDERADAFLVLAGGYGTLEELVEMLTLKILGYTGRPLVILNTAGYWDPLLALFDHFDHTGFGQKKYQAHFQVVDTPEAAIAACV